MKTLKVSEATDKMCSMLGRNCLASGCMFWEYKKVKFTVEERINMLSDVDRQYYNSYLSLFDKPNTLGLRLNQDKIKNEVEKDERLSRILAFIADTEIEENNKTGKCCYVNKGN